LLTKSTATAALSIIVRTEMPVVAEPLHRSELQQVVVVLPDVLSGVMQAMGEHIFCVDLPLT